MKAFDAVCQSLEDRFNQKKDAMETEVAQRHKDQMDRLRSSEVESSVEIQRLRNQISHMEQQLEQAQQEHEQLQRQLDAEKETSAALQVEKTELTYKVGQLRKEQSNKDVHFEAIQKRNKHLSDLERTLLSENEKLRAENTRLSDEVQRLLVIEALYKDQQSSEQRLQYIKSKEAELAQKEAASQEQLRRLEALGEENKHLQAREKRQTEQIGELQAKVQELGETRQRLGKEEEKNREYEMEIAGLQAQLSDVKHANKLLREEVQAKDGFASLEDTVTEVQKLLYTRNKQDPLSEEKKTLFRELFGNRFVEMVVNQEAEQDFFKDVLLAKAKPPKDRQTTFKLNDSTYNDQQY